MTIFKCPNCSSTVFFENSYCLNCNNVLGYNAVLNEFCIPKTHNASFKNNLKFCENHQYSVCNWLIDDCSESKFCVACQLNRKVPNPADKENFEKWKKLEVAKHRLIYQLIKLNLPLTSKLKDDEGIAFDFISENNKENLVTGHANGVVTILLAEADSVHIERLRKQMEEPYRTLLGHFRHEIGHYYWELLFKDKSNIEAYRNLFGNEQLDYKEALKNYYKNGAQTNWSSSFISKYASSHSWEDWAETWAHYLHIFDILETANAMSISLPSNLIRNNQNFALVCPDPYKTQDFKVVFNASMTLTSAVNSLNRSMGLADVYPFIVPKPVYEKLNFIHLLLSQNK